MVRCSTTIQRHFSYVFSILLSAVIRLYFTTIKVSISKSHIKDKENAREASEFMMLSKREGNRRIEITFHFAKYLRKLLLNIFWIEITSRISHSNLIRRVSAIPIFSTNIKRIKKANQ
ncbi:unnamed protein product [Rhizophagus irregularis]|nr:unnamed protein product [Rhizophagus irregularis]